jgi:hypothetical protein
MLKIVIGEKMKIFGIGLSRTGTVTLTDALKILGYDAAHDTPMHPSKMWEYIEKHEAFTDSQIAIHYKILDLTYPGSKFILTDRDIDKWLKSYETFIKYWKPVNNLWKTAINFPLYDTKEFDRIKFAIGYVKHKYQAIDHFKDRPDDFLIMNFEKGDGWEKLCKFLGKEKPRRKVSWSEIETYEVPFPHQNKSEDLIKNSWVEDES